MSVNNNKYDGNLYDQELNKLPAGEEGMVLGVSNNKEIERELEKGFNRILEIMWEASPKNRKRIQESASEQLLSVTRAYADQKVREESQNWRALQIEHQNLLHKYEACLVEKLEMMKTWTPPNLTYQDNE